jgi:hypothetical protein
MYCWVYAIIASAKVVLSADACNLMGEEDDRMSMGLPVNFPCLLPFACILRPRLLLLVLLIKLPWVVLTTRMVPLTTHS